jgi:branched-chain amino acid transport system ATP-binding protein
VVEHNIEFVMAVCDKVYVFDVGRLIFSGTPRQAREDEGVFNAYLGGATARSEAAGAS